MSTILLFNKPFGIVSQFTGEIFAETLSNYIDLPDFYVAGRLDKTSEGLLILTNDGQLQHRLSHPHFAKKKYYWVQIEGCPIDEDLIPLRKGLVSQNTSYLPAEVKIIREPPSLWPRTPPIRFRKTVPTSWLEIILSEGKNHQIRKMTAALGFPTLRLIRYRIANWSLGELEPGESRLLNVDKPI